MKFVEGTSSINWYFSADNGNDYRTHRGQDWERLYGESWETVVNYAEETELRAAWIEYMKMRNEEYFNETL